MNTAPGFLLTMPGYDGTLAAVRCLGSHGVPAYVATDQLLAPATWSRHVSRRFACPAPRPVEELLSWLLAFGRRHRGHVLYPTSDDLAWLFATNERELARYFRLYSPPLEVILRVLDKRELYRAARDVGIATPASGFPTDEAGVEPLASGLPYPVLIKPRTQALLSSKVKGEVVVDTRGAADRYRAFMAENRYADAIVAQIPNVVFPMLQEYSASAAGSIYSLSGFCGKSDDEFVVRASVKVLQWPRRVGVGICFEDAPVDPDLAVRLRSLCSHLGYFGVFEAEFVKSGRDYQLIDFNPRFFGQMGFDVARELPAPHLVYLGAHGDREGLGRAVERARAWRPDGRRVYVNRVALESSLLLERLLSVCSAQDARRWQSWRSQAGTQTTDAFAVDGDRLPALVRGASQLFHVVRHPRSVIRATRRGM